VKGGIGIAFWNVAGLRSKDRDFWESLKGWDIIILLETWVEEKGGDKREATERICMEDTRGKKEMQERKSDGRNDGHQERVGGEGEEGSKRDGRSYDGKGQIWKRQLENRRCT